ncbi:MAG: hypothetical protein ACJ71K_09245 [Nitrososphaeraceae archaeon]|jgi:hypothetical protein
MDYLSLRRDDIRLLEYSETGASYPPKIGPKMVSSSITFWYRIGEDDTKEIISKMQSIKADKKYVFDNALKYYRVAVCSVNPYQAIESFFSCVHSIIRDNIGKTNNVSQGDLENGLLQVVSSHVTDL